MLEPDRQVVHGLDSAAAAEHSQQRRGDQRGEHVRLGGPIVVSEQVVEQDDSQLVAGHHSPHTARVGGGHGKSVGVGVSGQDKDLSILTGGGDCRREDLRAFGVGQLVGHRGEVPVGIGLGFEQLDADETRLVKYRQNRTGPDPTKW